MYMKGAHPRPKFLRTKTGNTRPLEHATRGMARRKLCRVYLQDTRRTRIYQEG